MRKMFLITSTMLCAVAFGVTSTMPVGGAAIGPGVAMAAYAQAGEGDVNQLPGVKYSEAGESDVNQLPGIRHAEAGESDVNQLPGVKYSEAGEGDVNQLPGIKWSAAVPVNRELSGTGDRLA